MGGKVKFFLKNEVWILHGRVSLVLILILEWQYKNRTKLLTVNFFYYLMSKHRKKFESLCLNWFLELPLYIHFRQKIICGLWFYNNYANYLFSKFSAISKSFLRIDTPPRVVSRTERRTEVTLWKLIFHLHQNHSTTLLVLLIRFQHLQT